MISSFLYVTGFFTEILPIKFKHYIVRTVKKKSSQPKLPVQSQGLPQTCSSVPLAQDFSINRRKYFPHYADKKKHFLFLLFN